MISAKTLLQTAGKFASDNSPTLLTSIGVVGVVSTAVLTGKASFQAAELIEGVEMSETRILDLKEKAQLVWKEYIPAAVVGTTTIGVIISANRIGSRRTAAMAAAYTISEKAFVEYKDKVVEHIGKKKEQAVRDEVAQDRVAGAPVPGSLVVMTGNKQLCFDGLSGRYFHSTMEDLKKAQNDLNHRIISDNYASVTDLYDLIGSPHLTRTQMSDEIGWNVDRLLEINFTTCISPDQIPAIAMDFRVDPIRGFHRLH